AAREIAFGEKATRIYMFGDYDPSGRDIIRFISEEMRGYAAEVDPDVDIEFEVAAVTADQIDKWDLPGHPAKTSDSRYSRYGISHAVELEAIPPDRLRGLVRNCITSHIDPGAYQRLKEVEKAERETLLSIARGGR